MRHLPISFNSEMVKAILSGQKTQTRRPANGKRLIVPDAGDNLWVKETHWTNKAEPNRIIFDNEPKQISRNIDGETKISDFTGDYSALKEVRSI